MSYTTQYMLACANTVLIAVFGAILLADPVTLGITVAAAAWCKIAMIGCSAAAAFLPRVTAKPSDQRQDMD